MITASKIDPETLRRAHGIMVEILEEIDRICTKHDIKWWIQDGTLLGAVRHHGFIPWDDDCDIGMMRSDYEKFAKVAPKELKEPFFLQTKDTDPKYNRFMRKIRKRGTKLVEHDEDINEAYDQGIFVDIFIWDHFSLMERPLINLFNIMPGIRSSRLKYPRGSIKRTIHGLATALPYAIHKSFELIYLSFRKLIRGNKNLSYVSYEAEMGTKCFYKYEDMFPLKRNIIFADKHFPVPNNCDKYLSVMYGDYMQLPPPEQRATHAKLIEC